MPLSGRDLVVDSDLLQTADALREALDPLDGLVTVVHYGPHVGRDVESAVELGPVAVLPHAYTWPGEPRHVGVAYDGSPESEAALHAGYALAAAHGAALTVFCGAESAAFAPRAAAWGDGVSVHERLDAVLAAAPEEVNPERRVLQGDAVIAIAAEATGVVDLLVVGRRRLGPVKRAILGSFSSRMLAYADFPVVLVTG